MIALSPLIATKFHPPPARTDLVRRPRLYQLLERGMSQPLTLVSAPPGFGKTTLLADWVESYRLKVARAISQPSTFNLQPATQIAWLSLDEADNRPLNFWRYFIAALQQQQSGLGETAQAMLAAVQPPEITTILATLINELAALRAPLLLVLDDYHLVQAPEIHAAMKFLLDHQPGEFHLVLLTREDPPLGLARRRARRQVVEIRAADLRFSAEEAAAFLNHVMGLSLTAEQVEALERRTEGWIVGLQMAAIALQEPAGAAPASPQAFIESFAGDDRYIGDYLVEEVLQRQPESVRAFLLKTSILERMCASLCDAISGEKEIEARGLEPYPLSPNPSGSQAVLEYLDKSNLFLVPLDNRREWYRYHHLFAELLRQRLAESAPAEEMARLHRAASEWFAAHADISAAFAHACQIPDLARAATLLEQNALLYFIRSELPQLVELVRRLPAPLVDAHPRLGMAVAWAALATSQPAEPWLQGIERHFGLEAEAALDDPALDLGRRAAMFEVLLLRQQGVFPAHDPQTRPRLQRLQQVLDSFPPGQVCLFNAAASLQPVLAYNLGLDAELAGETELAAQAYEKVVRLSRETSNLHLLNLALPHLAQIQVAQARLHAAYQTYTQALAEQATLGLSPYAALAHAGLAWLSYEWGDFSAAEKHFAEGLRLARPWQLWEGLVPLALGQARLQRRRGEIQAAYRTLRELQTPPYENARLQIEALQALWQAQDGDPGAAARWLASGGLTPTTPLTQVTEPILLDVARLLCALNRPDEAAALARRLVAAARQRGRTHGVIQGSVLLVKALALQGNPGEALPILAEAVRCASPEGYLSTFVDEGEPIRRLLAEVHSRLPAGDPAQPAIERLLAVFPAEARPPEKEAGRPTLLSEREREILRLMQAGLTNQEIAEKLFISITTVKTHAGNIFNKLGVSNRQQAIARGQALGLLPRR